MERYLKDSLERLVVNDMKNPDIPANDGLQITEKEAEQPSHVSDGEPANLTEVGPLAAPSAITPNVGLGLNPNPTFESRVAEDDPPTTFESQVAQDDPPTIESSDQSPIILDSP